MMSSPMQSIISNDLWMTLIQKILRHRSRHQGHVVGTEEMDNNDDILDEIGEMDDFEAAKFQDKILPIHLTLVKVRNIDCLQRSKYSLSSCSCEKYPLKW